MSTHLDESAKEVRYLLGELSEEEAQSLEESFFANDGVFENLRASESEVIDAYFAGQLTNKQRQHFLQRVAVSPRLRERVAFAKAFALSTAAGKAVDPDTGSNPAVHEPWWKKLFHVPLLGALTPVGSFAALIAVLVFTAVIVQSIRLRSESQRLEGERAALERQRDEIARLAAEERNRTASELRDAQARAERDEELLRSVQQRQPETQPNQQSLFASLTLFPGGGVRSGGTIKELNLPPGATEVHLQLALLSVDYHTYQVTINGPTSNQINRTTLKPTRKKTLALRLPANIFSSGQHTVQVSGVSPSGDLESVSDYSFKVVKK